MYTYEAKITKVTDGDTVHADINLGFGIVLTNTVLRLYGINAPELKGESAIKGQESKNRLAELVLNKTVTIKTFKDKKEKYGRLLAQIWLDNISVNEVLISEGFAQIYLI
jgi:micrococcal nuclease